MKQLLGVGVMLAGLLLTACAATPTPSNGASMPSPTALSPFDLQVMGAEAMSTAQAASTLAAVANAQATQAAFWLTATPVAATQAQQATAQAVQLTETAFNRQLVADAATSTAQFAATQQRAVELEQTQSAAQRQTQVVAQTATAWPPIATQTQVALNSLILQEQQRKAEASWQQATAWFWPLFWIVVAVLLAVGGWKLLRVLEMRQRIVPSANGGAPMLLVEQKRSLEPYLPAFLRWIAWLVETNQVVVDTDRSVHPITVLENGQATQPAQASEAAQVQVAQSSQAMDALRAVGTERQILKNLWAKATGQEAPTSNLLPAAAGWQVTPAPTGTPPLREAADAGQVEQWVNEVERKLLEGPTL